MVASPQGTASPTPGVDVGGVFTAFYDDLLKKVPRFFYTARGMGTGSPSRGISSRDLIEALLQRLRLSLV